MQGNDYTTDGTHTYGSLTEDDRNNYISVVNVENRPSPDSKLERSFDQRINLFLKLYFRHRQDVYPNRRIIRIQFCARPQYDKQNK